MRKITPNRAASWERGKIAARVRRSLKKINASTEKWKRAYLSSQIAQEAMRTAHIETVQEAQSLEKFIKGMDARADAKPGGIPVGRRSK